MKSQAKMTRQDFILLIFYFLGYSRYRSIIFRYKKKPVARFLAYHDVLPRKIKQFDKNMSLLKFRTNVISLDQFFEHDLSTRKINTVITFDDGYKSWITHVIPVLKKYELPAAFFISSGFIGLDKKEEAEFSRNNLLRTAEPEKSSGCLERSDVKKLVDEGYTVGGHTISHLNLANANSYEIIRHEISEDKKSLESIIGSKLKYFAYPFGGAKNSGIDISRVLKEFGYKAALTIDSGYNHYLTDPYLLHRDIMVSNMNSVLFLATVLGNLDAVHYSKRLIPQIFLRPDKDLY